MSYPRHPLSSPGPGVRMRPVHRGPMQLGMLRDNSDPEALFDMLGRAVAHGSIEPDVIHGAVAEAAQALTSASGAALAILHQGAFICRARSGQTAPPLGAQLSVDSGISGECLRTGSSLRCNDTENDQRVDPDVCRQMGLRSIAVVPVRDRQAPAGILEVFSTRSYAFTENHTHYLARLADIVEAAQKRKTVAPEPTSATDITIEGPPEDKVYGTLEKLAVTREESVVRAHKFSRRLRYAMMAAIPVLVLACAIFLEWWKPALGNTSPLRASTSQSSGQSAVATPVEAPSQAASPAFHTPDAKPNPAIQRASKVEIAATRSTLTRVSPTHGVGNVLTPPRTSHTGPAETPEIPPPLAGDHQTTLTSLLSTTTVLPALSVPVSHFSEGSPLRRVMPTYPVDAFPLRLQGSVVVLATVAPEGKVEEVKVVSGNAILARAAVEAVRQWRYHPFLLDGKPIRAQTQITLNFKAP